VLGLIFSVRKCKILRRDLCFQTEGPWGDGSPHTIMEKRARL